LAYKIISPREVSSNTNTNGLGISLVSGDQLFQTNYISIDQAYENLKNLLLTRLGERILQPNFGTRLFNILFQPNVFQLKDDIQTTISEAVSFWLPYVNLDVINVVTNEDNPDLVHYAEITITFSINGFETATITLELTDTGTIIVDRPS
jgi:phage baseplate assembly protein W